MLQSEQHPPCLQLRPTGKLPYLELEMFLSLVLDLSRKKKNLQVSVKLPLITLFKGRASWEVDGDVESAFGSRLGAQIYEFI